MLSLRLCIGLLWAAILKQYKLCWENSGFDEVLSHSPTDPMVEAQMVWHFGWCRDPIGIAGPGDPGDLGDLLLSGKVLSNEIMG